jgi:hypothetical protein
MPIAIAALLLAASAPADSPRAFIEGVYQRYRSADFNPFEHPERYFTPKLAKALDDDATIDPGEVGMLDYDPLCQCQDDSGMRTKVQAVTQRGATADARVSVYFGSRDQRDIHVKLERTRAGWRIADVVTRDEPSLLADLVKSNRERRAHKKTR